MKKIHSGVVWAIVIALALIHQSCQQDPFEPDAATSGELKNIAVEYDCNDCFTPGGPYLEQNFRIVVQWGGPKNNKFTKTVNAEVYNTTEHLVLKVKSSHNISGIRINFPEGKSERISGPVSKGEWFEKTFDLPENLQVCDPFHFELVLTGDGPQAVLKVDYKLKEECKAITSVTDFDNNVYPVVKIGKQYWTAENLRVTRYGNGDLINRYLSLDEWVTTKAGAYAVYYQYGLLYNWFATVDPRGLCPAGWHVPTDEDWLEMTNYLIATYPDVTAENISFKLRSTTGWTPWEPINYNGTDDFGFNGYPGGVIWPSDGKFYGNVRGGYWWSSTIYPHNNEAWARSILYPDGIFRKYVFPRTGGMSIRCIRY
jgi:uncharacterized protein (TIGR02145 family)